MITNVDRGDEFAESSAGYRIDQIEGCIKNIRAAADRLRQNANPRLTLEVLMLDIPGKESGSQVNRLTL